MSENKIYKAVKSIVCGKQYHVPADEVVDTAKLNEGELEKLIADGFVKPELASETDAPKEKGSGSGKKKEEK